MNGPNPVLVVRDHLPEYIADLEDERDKIIERLVMIRELLAVAYKLQAVVGEPIEKETT